MAQSGFDIQVEFYKAMGHPVRLQVIHLLRETPLSVGELALKTGLSQPAISYQLQVMRSTGLVTFQRYGTELIYQLTNAKIGEIYDLVYQVISEQSQQHSKIIRE